MECHRGGTGNTGGEDPAGDPHPHRGEGPAGDPPWEGRAPQGTHTEHTQVRAAVLATRPNAALAPTRGGVS